MSKTAADDLPTTLKTDDDAERTMLRLSTVTNTRKILAAERDLAITEIREEYRERLDALDATKRKLEGRLKAWAKKQVKKWREEKRESRDLTHGRLGFRKPNSNGLKQPRAQKSRAEFEAKVLAKLEQLGLTHLIAVHRSVDWQELAKESDEVLEAVGVKRLDSEPRFYVEPRTLREPTVMEEPPANDPTSGEGAA